jgi:hypothetical protein
MIWDRPSVFNPKENFRLTPQLSRLEDSRSFSPLCTDAPSEESLTAQSLLRPLGWLESLGTFS